jgi:alpha-2-macroglobulin-like protein
LKNAGTIDYYEVRPRELVLCWRSLAAKRRVEWKVDLKTTVPGKFVGPASCAYVYDTPESKRWTDPLAVEITRD